MRLDQATWREAEAVAKRTPGIILPTGSTEQHGPIGLIGTDAICAGTIAEAAAEKAHCLVAPTLAYTPAPFNMAFAGTVSVSPDTFRALVGDIFSAFCSHGFRLIYVLNGHGANLEPVHEVAEEFDGAMIRIRNWWDFDAVNALRSHYYGEWEGMHATPSEIAITQAIGRIVPPGVAIDPPEKLSADYILRHAGDRHGPPDAHRQRFPDGRVGSHSALARPEHGRRLIAAATNAVANDFTMALGAITRC